jgi:hypothetical protein
MEDDVVAASVKNAFAQGCERVFLVDNESPDRTVSVAVEAGAELAESFSTRTNDPFIRHRLMDEVVARASAADGSAHIWWLWIDADEFSNGPRGLSVREFLSTLDESFRIVGARYINHYPGSEPHYLSGFHPLDFQPLAEELPDRTCWSWHRKHPLQRFDRGRPEIQSNVGFHWCESTERPLHEPTESIFIHHFPFRRKEAAVRRMGTAFAQTPGLAAREGPPESSARLQALEAVYAQDWETVRHHIAPRFRRPEGAPVPWAELVEPEHVAVRRWYSAEDLASAIARDADRSGLVDVRADQHVVSDGSRLEPAQLDRLRELGEHPGT